MNKNLYQDLYELEEKHWWHISKRELCQKVIAKYFKGGKIVDIGCGTGKNVESFSKFGEVWGIDNSEEALKFCKKRGLEHVSKGDAEKSNLPSNAFSLVTLLDVLEHTDDTKTLKEIRRILKKDGLLLITVPAYQWMWSQWDVELHHKRRYTKEGLEKLLSKSGYEIVLSSYRQSFMVLPVYLFRKIKTFFKPLDYGSDFKIGSPFINVPLLYVTKLEHEFVTTAGVPFGVSILTLARKK